MHPSKPLPAWCRVAACREDLSDGSEWSLYVLNDLGEPIEVMLKRVSYEWVDNGHSVAPGTRLHLRQYQTGLLWREKWEGAEMNMELQLHVEAGEKQMWLSFELGKLYRKRNPVEIEGLGRLGWLHVPT